MNNIKSSKIYNPEKYYISYSHKSARTLKIFLKAIENNGNNLTPGQIDSVIACNPHIDTVVNALEKQKIIEKIEKSDNHSNEEPHYSIIKGATEKIGFIGDKILADILKREPLVSYDEGVCAAVSGNRIYIIEKALKELLPLDVVAESNSVPKDTIINCALDFISDEPLEYYHQLLDDLGHPKNRKPKTEKISIEHIRNYETPKIICAISNILPSEEIVNKYTQKLLMKEKEASMNMQYSNETNEELLRGILNRSRERDVVFAEYDPETLEIKYVNRMNSRNFNGNLDKALLYPISITEVRDLLRCSAPKKKIPDNVMKTTRGFNYTI